MKTETQYFPEINLEARVMENSKMLSKRQLKLALALAVKNIVDTKRLCTVCPFQDDIQDDKNFPEWCYLQDIKRCSRAVILHYLKLAKDGKNNGR